LGAAISKHYMYRVFTPNDSNSIRTQSFNPAGPVVTILTS
jgi:hypothetical protein